MNDYKFHHIAASTDQVTGENNNECHTVIQIFCVNTSILSLVSEGTAQFADAAIRRTAFRRRCVSPTRRFAARTAFRRRDDSPHGASPTWRFDSPRSVSPIKRFAVAASSVCFDNRRKRRASLNPNPCHQNTRLNPESEYFKSVAASAKRRVGETPRRRKAVRRNAVSANCP